MQQCFNSNYHQNFTTNKESRKTFLNFMHGGREGAGGGGGGGGEEEVRKHCCTVWQGSKTESRDYRENWYPKL